MRLALFVCCALPLFACTSDGLSSTNNDLGDYRGRDLASTTRNDLGDYQDCSQWTDDSSCSANDCTPLDCSNCGNSPVFSGCYANGQVPECQPPPCVAPQCDSMLTEAQCNANSDCTALFTQAACECAGTDCCPMVYESCTATGSFECAPPGGGGSCPFEPDCESGYVAVYSTNGCQLGCVEVAVCTA